MPGNIPNICGYIEGPLKLFKVQNAVACLHFFFSEKFPWELPGMFSSIIETVHELEKKKEKKKNQK